MKAHAKTSDFGLYDLPVLWFRVMSHKKHVSNSNRCLKSGRLPTVTYKGRYYRLYYECPFFSINLDEPMGRARLPIAERARRSLLATEGIVVS